MQRRHGADVGMCIAGGYDGYFRRPAAAAAAAAAASGDHLQTLCASTMCPIASVTHPQKWAQGPGPGL